MGQLSFFSAEARLPRIADLAGILCGPGQAVGFGRGTAARLSVVVADTWRADSLVAACAERGVEAELGRSDEGYPLLRTAFRADLTELAGRWLRGAVKSVPSEFVPDGPVLRLWVLTAGHPDAGGGYSLGLDPHAPDTHAPLASALDRAGLPAKLVGPRGGGPVLRVSGRRRVERLAELVGPVPAGAVGRCWPPAP
ncbi:hypothetical protein DFQ14_11271 [Halopolyspora algeriensis]|uniref:Uncharacterized protein n=1 Tax=Halopolyspora algeriensis TaxID=1500506 RepID=A0A368VGH1_9ACTN|nr:hypothetical protein [Halopolyspora algeriensis]RCW40191.1 hypothetical protein DFQ14_11271 [Halopolyspora algeriensis]TQM46327.1 hypothetical protein FHU43_3999 [Halopolyspora algeriensis]